MPPDLVDQLRGGEAPVDAGRFRIDSQRALEKLRQFRLADPHHYVLELLRAAVASRASWAAVRTDADDFELRFDGEPFKPAQLKELLAQALLGGSDRDAVRGRLLSLGVAGALAMDPRWVRIQSGEWLVELDAGARATVSRAPPLPARGTTSVHVRERLSWRVARDAVLGSREAKVIAELCRELPIPLTMNAQPLEAAGAFDEPLLARAQREKDGVRVWAAFPGRRLEHSLVRFHLFGVQVCERRWTRLPTPILATVHDDSLRRNASGSDVVETDPRYQRALAMLEGLVEPLLESLAQRLRASPEPEPLARELLLRASEQASGRTRALLDAAPLLPGPSGEWSSANDFRAEHAAGRPLRFATRAYPAGAYTRPALLMPGCDERALKLLPGKPRVDVAEEIAVRATALQHRQRWEAQEVEQVQLPGREYLLRAPVVSRGFTGEVGVRAQPGTHRPTVRVLVEHKLLFVESPEGLPLGTVAVVNLTSAPALSSWAKPQAGVTLQRFLGALQEALTSAAAEAVAAAPELPGGLRALARWLLARALRAAQSESGLALPEALRRAQVYELAGGGHASLQDLLSWPTIRHVEQPWSKPLLSGDPAVTLEPRGELADLERLLGEDRLLDVTDRLRKERRVRERIDAGPERVECRTPLLVSLPIRADGFRGVVGLPIEVGAWTQLRLYARGILVEEVSLTPQYGLAAAAIASDELRAREDWAVVVRDEVFDRALEQVRRVERELVEPLLHQFGKKEWERWPAAGRRYFRAFAHKELTGLLSQKALDPQAAAAAAAAIFPTSQGLKSLRFIAEDAQRDRCLWVQEVPDRREVPDDMLVVYADASLSTMLKAVAQVPEAEPARELERRAAAEAFRSRAARPAKVDASLPLIVPVEGEEGLRGEVGGPARHVGTQLELSLGGRHFASRHLETTLGMDAAIDLPEGSVDPAEPLSPLWERAVVDAVEEGELALLELGAERWDRTEARALVYLGLGANLDARMAHPRRQALLDRPLVPTGDGGWLPVSHFDELRSVGFVTRRVGGVPRGGPVVLADSRAVSTLLPRWRAADVTARVEEELAARARRASIPPQRRFAYAGQAAIRRVPLRGTEAKGEIAFLSTRTGCLELFHQGRPLCLVSEDALPPSVAVVVNDDRLTPTPDEAGVVRDRAYLGLVREIGEQLDRISSELAAEWEAAGEVARIELRPLALQLAAWQARRKGARSPLLALPLLETSDGKPMQLVSLIGARTTGRPVLWSSVPGAPLEESRPIWRPRPGERPLLAELELPLEDVSARVRAAEERREQARKETFQVPLPSPWREPMLAPRRGEVVLPPDGPSGQLQLSILKDGVLLETLVLPHEVGAVAKVDDPALSVAKEGAKARRNAAFRAMRVGVELALERALARRLASPEPWRLAYARAAIRWRGGTAGPLAAALPGLELFRDMGGRPVRLGEVMSEISRRGAVGLLDRELAAAAPADRLVLLRDPAAEALLQELQLRGEDLGPEVRAARELEASRAARRLHSLRFAGEALVRLEVDRPGGFRGELALPMSAANANGVTLAREGVAVAEWPLGELGVSGVLEHPALAVDAAWRSAELTREQRQDLQEEVEALFRRLAGVSPAFEPAQRAAAAPHVLRYLREAGMKDASQLERLPEVAQRVAEAPVLRAAEGRWVGLRTAAAQALRRNGLAVLGAKVLAPEQLPELALEAADLEAEWVQLLGEVLGWKRVQLIRDLDAWREAQAHAEPPDDTPLARGLDRLRREAALLRGEALGGLTTQELAQLRLHRRGGRGAPVRYREDRREATLDPDHPLVRGALEAAADRPEGLYVLLASIYGAVNRALERVTDEDEARMLDALTRHLAANPELLEPKDGR